MSHSSHVSLISVLSFTFLTCACPSVCAHFYSASPAHGCTSFTFVCASQCALSLSLSLRLYRVTPHVRHISFHLPINGCTVLTFGCSLLPLASILEETLIPRTLDSPVDDIFTKVRVVHSRRLWRRCTSNAPNAVQGVVRCRSMRQQQQQKHTEEEKRARVGVESVGLEMQLHAECIAVKSYLRHS